MRKLTIGYMTLVGFIEIVLQLCLPSIDRFISILIGIILVLLFIIFIIIDQYRAINNLKEQNKQLIKNRDTLSKMYKRSNAIIIKHNQIHEQLNNLLYTSLLNNSEEKIKKIYIVYTSLLTELKIFEEE